MAGNTEHILATIAAVARSVASEKKPIMEEIELLHPSRTVVNPRLAKAAGLDLDVYFQWNNYIQSGTMTKKVVIRANRPAQVSFEGTLRVTLANARAALARRKLERESLHTEVETLREQIAQLASSRKIKDIQSCEEKQKELKVLSDKLSLADEEVRMFTPMLKKPEGDTHVHLPKALPPQDGIAISMRVPVGEGNNPRFPSADMKKFMTSLWGKPDVFLESPEGSVLDSGKPKPLPEPITTLLVAMRPQDRLAQASIDALAWWYVILTYNHSRPQAKRVALHRSLWFAKYAPVSSPTRPTPSTSGSAGGAPDIGGVVGAAPNLAAMQEMAYFQELCVWAAHGLYAFDSWHSAGADTAKHCEGFPLEARPVDDPLKDMGPGPKYFANLVAYGTASHPSQFTRADALAMRARWSEVPRTNSTGVKAILSSVTAQLGKLKPSAPPVVTSMLEVPDSPNHIIDVKGTRFEAIPEIDSIPEGKMLACLRKGSSVYVSHAEARMEKAADKRSLSLPPPEKASPVASTSRKGKERDPAERPEQKKKTPDASKDETVGAQDVLDTLNPAKVVNPPRSQQLTDEQRSRVRKALKLLEDLVPPAQWEAMDSQAKAAAAKKRSIPHWATAFVLSDPAALRVLEDGEVKSAKEAASWKKAKGPKTSPQSEITHKWLKLREKYKGEALVSNPVTPKEKQFFKEYTDLKKSVGESAALPVPKERTRARSPSPNRGRSAQRNATSSSSSDDTLDQMMKLLTLKMMRDMTSR